MKAMLTSFVLSLALLLSPGMARATTTMATQDVPTTMSNMPTEFDVVGLSLTAGFGQFTGKIKLKGFVMVNGILKVKVSLRGTIVDAHGALIVVNLDEFLIAVVDLDASCEFVKLALPSIKVKVHVLGLEVVIRLEEVVIIVESRHCGDRHTFCRLGEIIHCKKKCHLIVKLLIDLWGFRHDDDDDHCGGGHGGGGGGGHGGGGHGDHDDDD